MSLISKVARRLFLVPKELEEGYIESIVSTNMRTMFVGIIAIVAIQIINLSTVLFFTSHKLSTLNNRMYAGLYLSLIVCGVMFLYAIKLAKGDIRKIYILQVVGAWVYLLWGMAFSVYELFAHGHKMMVFALTMISCVACVRTKPLHILPIQLSLTAIMVAINQPYSSVSAITEALSFIVASVVVAIIFHIQEVEKQSYQKTIRDVHKTLQQQRTLAIDVAQRERHDIRHHNRMLSEFVRDGKYDEFFHYLEIYDKNAEGELEIYCKNIYASSVIASFAREARASGISFSWKTVIPEDIFVDPIDITNVFSNMLENALNACKKSVEKKPSIDLKSYIKGGKLVIKCINTCNGDVDFGTDGLPKCESRKGVGIASIMQVLKKHDGEAIFRIEDGKMVVRLIMASSGEGKD